MTARPGRRRAVPALVTMALASVLGCTTPETTMPECEPGGRLATLAQSVPTASRVPCVAEIPVGWNFDSLDVDSGLARFWLDSDRAGLRAAEIELVESCDTSGATAVDPEEDGAARYQRLSSLSPRFIGTTYDVFEGGCVVYRYELVHGPHIALYQELHEAVALFPRRALRDDLREDLGLDLDP